MTREERYIDLAKEKTGRWSTTHYALPTGEVLEIHRHPTLPGDDLITTITRPGTVHKGVFSFTPELVGYHQVGLLVGVNYGEPFSATGIAQRRTGREDLRTLEGIPLCSSRNLPLTTPASENDLEEEIRKMEAVTKQQKIIYLSPFPSHRGRPREAFRRG